MAKQNKKLTVREVWARSFRAWKIWWKLCPQIYPSMILECIFTALAPYVTIWFSAQIINELAGNRNPEQLMKLVLCQLAVTAAVALIKAGLSYWTNLTWNSLNRLNDKVWMAKMMDLDYADVDRQPVYDLYAQIVQTMGWDNWGIRRVIRTMRDIITPFARILGGVTLSVSLFLLPVPQSSGLAFLNHPIFVVLMVALMLAIAVLSSKCTNRAHQYETVSSDETLLANRIMMFWMDLCFEEERTADLRMYNQQRNVGSPGVRYAFEHGKTAKMRQLAKGPMGLLMAASQAISVVLTGVVYVFVCLKAWGGAFGVGSVTQYVGAITNLFLGIAGLLEGLGMLRTNAEFLGSNFEFLDIPNHMYQGSLTTEKRSDRNYEVEFRDVSFRYPGTDTWALRHVNMKFRVGSRLAVVGMNGSGKTTFIKLLCRLYDPTEGEILLNGIDIRKYRYDDYIALFSVVFQDFKLTALPLGENVAGRKDYDRERVLQCLEDAGFSERLAAMPDGLETCLYKEWDDKGVSVSGGEAQKIAIARALYKDAPFIILDEPTAALDPMAEAEIYSKFNDIAGDKTAVYISHRLSSCKFCDEIAVFHEGEVIQQGTHEALLADETGKYHELWNAQAQYYVSEQK